MKLSEVVVLSIKIHRDNHVPVRDAAFSALERKRLNPAQKISITRGIGIDVEAEEKQTLLDVVETATRKQECQLHFLH